METSLDNIPQFIRQHRRNKRMSQRTLGERAGFTRGIVAHIERGSSRLSLLQLIKLLDVLDLQVDIKQKGYHQCLDTN